MRARTPRPPQVSRAHRRKDGAKSLLSRSFQCTSDLLPALDPHPNLCEVLFWPCAGSPALGSHLLSVAARGWGRDSANITPPRLPDSRLPDASAGRGTRGRLEEEVLGAASSNSTFGVQQHLWGAAAVGSS